MAKIGIIKRLCLRALYWVLKNPEESQTAPVNGVLYSRCMDGKTNLMIPFSHPQVEVGDHTYGLRREAFFPYHPDDRVVIGKFCSIADGVRFVFGEHRTDTVSTFPFKGLCFGGPPHADSLAKGRIIVGHDVWIGANALILSGVQIGHGAIVAAGAVVTRDVPPYAVVAGVPARVLRIRLNQTQVETLLRIQWWDWPLEKIRANLGLFYGDPNAFIEKHGVRAQETVNLDVR